MKTPDGCSHRLWFKVEAPLPGVAGSASPDYQEICFDTTRDAPLVLRTELSTPKEAARLMVLSAVANGLLTDLTPDRTEAAWGATMQPAADDRVSTRYFRIDRRTSLIPAARPGDMLVCYQEHGVVLRRVISPTLPAGFLSSLERLRARGSLRLHLVGDSKPILELVRGGKK